MSEYTPTTDEVRRCYVGELDAITDGVVGEAFDRWLESVKAEAWDEGFDAGQQWESDMNSRTIPQVTRWDNPYLKEEK